MLEKNKMIQVFWKDLQNIFASAILIFAGNCNAKGGLSSLIFYGEERFFSLSSLHKREVMGLITYDELINTIRLVIDVVTICYIIFHKKK